LLGRALLVNFVVVPLLAFGLLRAFNVNAAVSIGIMLMAMAPGVPFLVTAAGRDQGGSLAFTLEIALLFSALSVVTLPLTAALLLPPEILTRLPVLKVIGPLVVVQLLPVIAAIAFAPRLKPETAKKAGQLLHIVFLAAATILVILLAPKIGASIAAVYGFGNLLVIAAIGVLAAAAGWLCAGRDRQFRRTLSVASLLRNVGMCMLIGTAAFPADSLVVPSIIAYFVVPFAISIPLRMYYKRTSAADAVPAV